MNSRRRASERRLTWVSRGREKTGLEDSSMGAGGAPDDDEGLFFFGFCCCCCSISDIENVMIKEYSLFSGDVLK